TTGDIPYLLDLSWRSISRELPKSPFLLAISCALGQGNMPGGVLFFGGFFAGTSAYLVLLLPLGYLGGGRTWRRIELIVALLSGVFFLMRGIARFMAL
ncbi:MAG: hypothetical protein U9N12_05980, partial [Euryarchaeota archaeon]|nr:hypothetical protein [Euryarchaeota archaeon]